MGETVRFGVSLDSDLLEKFDALCERQGCPSRSEALRDIIRDALVQDSLHSETADAAGVLSLSLEASDVLTLALFGLIGLFFAKTGCEGAPFLLGFLLGPLFEEHLRRALLLSHGDFSVFLTSPASAAALTATVLLLAALLGPAVRRKRDEAFGE